MSWYYAQGAARQGPVSEEAFTSLVRSGVIGDSTLVWRESMTDWRPYGEVKPASGEAVDTAPAEPGTLAFCSNCGRQVSASGLVAILGRRVCGDCKALVLQQTREGHAPAGGRVYGGFWVRFAAVLIDAVILGVAQGIVGLAFAGTFEPDAEGGLPVGFWRSFGLMNLINFGMGAAYQAIFLPTRGATPGKMVFGLRVIRPNGEAITPARAAGRFFAQIISSMILLIGYLMAVWDDEKRTLHDRICDTRVIRG